MSRRAADIVGRVIREKPDCRLGLATGGSPIGMYNYLVEDYRNGKLDFSRVDTINLDEYMGLDGNHPQSYRYFMNHYLFDHVNIDKNKTYVVNGVGDPEKNLAEFQKKINEKPIDVQVLGIGADGHVGFNEPSDALFASAHITDLVDSTIVANSKYFDKKEDVPKKAYTMGMGDILKAKKIVLIIKGRHKAEVVKELLYSDKITTKNPATMLRMHNDVTILIERNIYDIVHTETRVITTDEVLMDYDLGSEPVVTERFGNGHINDTYRVTLKNGKYCLLQKINKRVFTKPYELMENVSRVCDFVANKTADRRRSLHLVKTKEGNLYYIDAEGEFWRMYEYITDSICLDKAETPEDFYQSAVAFGEFQNSLADFDATTLYEVIPNFHNTVSRYKDFRRAIEENKSGRADECSDEIEFYLAHEKIAGEIVDKLASGELPTRVTHNDTKLNNVMLDAKTRTALCVIDLDTVMPGSVLYDFGDSIRFGASSADEDERDLSRVYMDLSLFEAYTKGFLSACGKSLTDKEKEMFPMGAIMMTLECGMRFLTDHLNGDTYFRISREGHNLDRSRTQMKLVQDMENKMSEMNEIVKKYS
ncbi:MAG: 6-phosphogluconolactonase [Clostridiales bacterium]|nr:6-phosphogluconolactonase [Clostridiales bacterium]